MHAQDDLNLCILHTFEGTFWLDMALKMLKYSLVVAVVQISTELRGLSYSSIDEISQHSEDHLLHHDPVEERR